MDQDLIPFDFADNARSPIGLIVLVGHFNVEWVSFEELFNLTFVAQRALCGIIEAVPFLLRFHRTAIGVVLWRGLLNGLRLIVVAVEILVILSAFTFSEHRLSLWRQCVVFIVDRVRVHSDALAGRRIVVHRGWTVGSGVGLGWDGVGGVCSVLVIEWWDGDGVWDGD